MSLSFRLEQRIVVPYTVVGRRGWIANQIDPLFPRERIRVVERPSELRPLIEELLAKPVLTVDTESSGPLPEDGLDPVSPSSYIVLFQI